jgi:hypothetical protein
MQTLPRAKEGLRMLDFLVSLQPKASLYCLRSAPLDLHSVLKSVYMVGTTRTQSSLAPHCLI